VVLSLIATSSKMAGVTVESSLQNDAAALMGKAAANTPADAMLQTEVPTEETPAPAEN